MAENETKESIEAVLATADVFIQFGRLDAAEKSLKTAVADFQGDKLALVLTKLGLVYELQGNFKQALQYLRQAVQHAQAAAEPGLCLAALLCDLSQYDEAKKAFAAAAGLDDNGGQTKRAANAKIATLHVQIAKHCEHSGRRDEAIRHLEQALELSPISGEAARGLAKLMVHTNKPKDLIRFLNGPYGKNLQNVERDVFEAIALSQMDGVATGTQKLQSIHMVGKNLKDPGNRRLAAEWRT